MPMDKQWTMNSILAGVEIGRLLKAHKTEKAREYLSGLTSELTPDDTEYLITRAYAIATKEVNNARTRQD